MKFANFETVDLSELLPRIPDANVLPFGVVKLDLTGKILEYNMAEGELTGIDPAWALGKNFFDDVAMCTKTPAFYGKFVEGVKKGFLNAVFNYSFTHRETPTRVRVHMMTLPNERGQKMVAVLVTRINESVRVTEAFQNTANPFEVDSALAETAASHNDAAANRVAQAVLLAANNQANRSLLATTFTGTSASASSNDILKF